MRYLTPVLIVLLLVSVIANGVMYLKFRSHRAIVTVNGTGLSKYDLDLYLETIYGVDYKASFARRTLVHDAAVKGNVAPSDEEVNQKLQEIKQINWQYANTMNSNPWLADEGRKSIRETLEFNRLLTKDIPVTPDEIKDEYKTMPPLYDTPSKAEAEVALIKPGLHTEDIVRLMKTDPPVKPSAIMSSYHGEARFIGDSNLFTFQQHFGTPEQGLVFGMKPGDVKELTGSQVPADIRAAGYTMMVVRLNKIIPGHKAEWTEPIDPKLPAADPKEMEYKQRAKDYKATQEAIRLKLALSRANPPRELLQTLLQNAKIDVEDEADLQNIKLKLLPPDDTSQIGAARAGTR